MILLLFLTKSEQLNDYINSGKKIWPEDYVKKRMETAICRSFLCKNNAEGLDFIEGEMRNKINELTGVIVFCDNSIHKEVMPKLGCSVLISELGDYSNHLDGSVNTKQYLEDQITVVLKVYFWIRASFESGFGEILRLPIRNFNDSDFKKICRKISKVPLSGNVAEQMEELSKAFSMLKRKVRKPKRRPHTSQKFYVDEKDYFFEYGKETHAQHEIDKVKGHDFVCDISARFRFGIKIDERKHFNVCKGDKVNSSIEGIFEDCHGADITIKKRTHINMFSNDYMA